jgi:type VI protein secretion system component VasK
MSLLQTCECCIIGWQGCCLLKVVSAVPSVAVVHCAVLSKAACGSICALLLLACCCRDMRQKSLANWKAAKDQEELEAAEWRAEQQELQRQVSSLLQISAFFSKLKLLLLVV